MNTGGSITLRPLLPSWGGTGDGGETVKIDGNIQVLGTFSLGNPLNQDDPLVTISHTDLNRIKINNAGEVQSEKVVTTDENLDISGLRNLTFNSANTTASSSSQLIFQRKRGNNVDLQSGDKIGSVQFNAYVKEQNGVSLLRVANTVMDWRNHG